MTGQRHPGLERFAAEITARLGFRVDQQNEDQVDQILRRRLEKTGCCTIEEYLAGFQDAKSAEKELREIALDLTVPETYFFRHPEHFQALIEVALPERMKAREASRRLNMLSAGCASGEEAYSLAAAVAGVAGLKDWDVHIRGIDINPHLMKKASQGRYSAWSLRGLSEAQRATHFRLEGDVYLLDASLLSAVHFESRNLLDDDVRFWQPDFFDVIFCRNVMIYFSSSAIRALAERLTRSLAPGGFLFLGPSETLRGVSPEFHLRHTHGAFYYQRRALHEPILPATEIPQARGRAHAGPVPAPQEESGAAWSSAIADSSNRIAALAHRADRRADKRSEVKTPTSFTGPAFPAEQDLKDVHDLLRQERFEDALKAIHALPAQGSADSDTLLLQAVILANQGELSQAEQICGQLLARDELRPGAHYLMAVCQERRDDHLSAAEHDQTAIYLEPAFAMPHLHLGLLARRLGDLQTARRELGGALVMLEREEASRILLFGGGFTREALMRFCQAQLDRCGGSR